MALSEEQAARYARHFPVPEIGTEGQEKLLASKVLVIGAGGLGSPATLYLTAAGVGTVGVLDSDVVELSNLQRQILHGTSDLGRPKVESAEETLHELNPGVRVVPYHMLAKEENLPAVLKDYDFVLECTDSFESKFLVSDACVRAGKPYCHASVIRFYGQVLTWVPGQGGPCFRCVFHNPPPEGAALTAKQAGVLGASAGVIGCLQAAEAVKYLLGAGELLTGQLLTCDLLDMEFQKIPLKRNPDCPACG
jgi:molybdopterin/thiamine biosynthesis adenylyltransferase